MSRAALWRQEEGSKERERQKEETFAQACEQGRANSKTAIWGNDSDFHWNPMLLRNTIQSNYFQKCCQNLNDWNAVIDEIYYEVKSLHVFGTAGGGGRQQPSTAFCLLLRLLTLRMTPSQIQMTIEHVDSPYIRGIGFLYLRFVCPPEKVYDFIEPYLHDPNDELVVEAHAAPRQQQQQQRGRGPRGQQQQPSNNKVTMGEFVRYLFQSRDYYGATTLPRYPSVVERDLQVKLLAADQIAERAQQHARIPSRMEYFSKLGNKVMALYGDDENPVTWYEAVVDRVLTRDPNNDRPLKHPKFVVTFSEYGNTETVTLGEMDTIEGRSRAGAGGEYPRNGGHAPRHGRDEEQDLYEQARQRERDRVAGSNKSSWHRRPPSTKESLSGGGGNSRREPRGYNNDDSHRSRSNHNSGDGVYHQHRPKLPPAPAAAAAAASSSAPEERAPQASKKRSPEELAAIAEKKRKLMAKYG